MEGRQTDVCRVCRCEGSSDKPLYHPCICTGSIKYIHQDCLVQWLKYSKKEYCELCKHRYTFMPIYAPDMPKRLPIRDLVTGLLNGILRAVRYWLHYTLVALAWLGIVPLTACRIYRCLFSGSLSAVLTLPLDLLSTDNLLSDCFQGCFIVTCTLCTFISLVWLREQIMHGGGPDWLDAEVPVDIERPANNNRPDNAAAAADEAGVANVGPDGAQLGGNVEENGEQRDENIDDEHADDDNDNNGQGQDEGNWNPMDWDRAAEDLTWERLLGLDGSLLFMEHVFWVVSLNTLFIMVFAFCPYHIGHFTVLIFRLQEMLTATHFDGLLTTLMGYIIIAITLATLHQLSSLLRWARSKRVLGLCYVAVKVSLLVIMEIGFFPLICGWWLDICSLSMFEATLKDRENSFAVAPGNSMFIHWLVGMVYIFYFASFILLLREVLRPGVLWFLRNLNDPDFNPIQEMIHLPVPRHIRRFVASMVVFGTIVLVMLWLPVQVVRKLFPTFLPFHVMLSSDTPVSELSLELLLLQVVLPALLEQGHTRQWLKSLVKGWCVMAAWLLDLRSYLLGDVALDEPASADGNDDASEQNDDQDEQPEELGAAADTVAAAETEELNQPGQAMTEGLAEGVLNEAVTDGVDSIVAETVLVPVHSDTTHLELSNNSCATQPLSDTGGLHSDDMSSATTTTSEKASFDSSAAFASENSTLSATAPVQDDDCAAVGGVQPLTVVSEHHPTKSFVDLESSSIVTVLFHKSGHCETTDRTDSSLPVSCGSRGSTERSPETNVSASVEDPDLAVASGETRDERPNLNVGIDEVPAAAAGAVADVNAGNGEHAAGTDAADANDVDDVVAQPPNILDVVPPAPPLDPPAPMAFLPVPPAQGLGDMHQAMMQGGGPIGYQPYKHPNLFALRLLCLLALVCFTLFVASLVSLLVPVYIGRQLMAMWTGETKIHELYTVACGLYACWVVLRMAMILYTWIPQGWHVIFGKVVEWTVMVSKSLFVALILIGIVPLMLGLIFELVVVMPIRVPLEMTPIFFPWQDWALGVLHAKIITAATMMGPQWRLKRVIEQVYQQGLRNMNLKFIMMELCLPVLVCLGFVLALPYIIANSLVPILGFDFETQNLVLRRIYPFILGVVMFVTFCIFQARQFWRLYEHIKNDKYLVGQRLVNYDRLQ